MPNSPPAPAGGGKGANPAPAKPNNPADPNEPSNVSPPNKPTPDDTPEPQEVDSRAGNEDIENNGE